MQINPILYINILINLSMFYFLLFVIGSQINLDKHKIIISVFWRNHLKVDYYPLNKQIDRCLTFNCSTLFYDIYKLI